MNRNNVSEWPKSPLLQARSRGVGAVERSLLSPKGPLSAGNI